MQFVTVMHTYEQCGVEVLRDQHQIVYLSNSSVARSDDRVARVEEVELTGRERRVELDPVFLFRFSALSFNAHRIHYDRAFAVEVEGYPGLVVHGPLQALLMAELAREVAPATEGYRFEYRLVSPLFEDQGLVVGATESEDNVETYVRDATGRTTATGRWWACTTSA